MVVYWSPSRLMDCAFLANTTGTLPKCWAATHAMPMPDASMVRILVMCLPAKLSGPCRTHAVEQAYVALVVQKRVHLEHITRLQRSLALDSLLKFLH